MTPADIGSELMHNSVVLNLLSSLIWVSIGYLALRANTKHRASRLWRLSPTKGDTIRIVTSTWEISQSPTGYLHSVVPVGDTAAVGHVTASLAVAYRNKCRVRTTSSAEFHNSYWDDTVVLIGGRVMNSITRDFLRRLEDDMELPLAIEDQGQDRRILDIESGRHYEAEFDGARIVRDYGVITRAPNPFNSGSSAPVFSFYGLHTFATTGIAKLLAPENFGALLASLPTFGKWFQLLIAVDVRNEEAFPRVILRRDLKCR